MLKLTKKSFFVSFNILFYSQIVEIFCLFFNLLPVDNILKITEINLLLNTILHCN